MTTLRMNENHQPITVPTVRDSAMARKILEQRIEHGRVTARGVLEKIHRDAPRDAIVRGGALRFEAAEGGARVAFGNQEPEIIHHHALGQLAGRAGIPAPYLESLSLSKEPWQRDLAVTMLSEHYQRGETANRFLARSVGGELRGFLSNRFRRLDSRPLVEAFAGECDKVGAVPVDGIASDTRVSLRALIPTIYEPVPGEVLAFGVEWHNSDFGAGLHSLRAFILRVWCLNGATLENALAQVHIGRQLTEDIELSQRTYELDTRASISAMRDVVSGILAPAKIEQTCAAIRAASEAKIAWTDVRGRLSKKLLKGELQQVKDAFESQDVVNLPPVQTMWRASNAVSWIAGRDGVDPNRRIELARIAGELVDGRKDRVEAEAA